MFAWTVQDLDILIQVSLKTNSIDIPAIVSYSLLNSAEDGRLGIRMLRQKIRETPGVFGHTCNSREATPSDMDYILTTLVNQGLLGEARMTKGAISEYKNNIAPRNET